jgi:integrase
MNATITPSLLSGRKTWLASFVNANGMRVNRSLGTTEKLEALAICHQLQELSRLDPDSTDAGLASVHEMAYRLWFDFEKPAFLRRDDDANASVFEVAKLRQRVAELERENERLLGFEAKYLDLASSVEGRLAAARKRSPTLGECEAPYEADCSGLAPRHASAHRLFLSRLINLLGTSMRVADIKAAQILSYIQWESMPKQEGKPVDPRRPVRIRAVVSRFFTWAARAYEIPSPMDHVPVIRVAAQRDIEWHSLEEVEVVLAGLSTYWAAVVACMAYAGLSAHEVRGLLRSDLQVLKGRRAIRVQPNDERGLKTANRRRSVLVSARLAPYLDAHLAQLGAGDLLFAAETDTGGLWRADYFSVCLNSWLPGNMTALSLRRTFGSLLIRSGKTEGEVAAAMGNTATMVRQHYARLLGGEIDLDF